jgi:signal transduction histidine kinase
MFIVSSSLGQGTDLRFFQINYLVFLFFTSAAYFGLLGYAKILSVLLGIEYFTVFFYAYIESSFLLMEMIWIPGIIAAAALTLPGRAALLLLPFFGIGGSLFFSHGSIYRASVLIGGYTLPYTVPALLLQIPVTLLSILLNRVCLWLEKSERRSASLELENKRFNEINHAISQRIFSLQNDTTQKERNRLSKEIHDTAGYVFINLIMMLQAASAVLRRDIGRAEKLIGDARDYAERGINEIRHLLRDIRDYSPVRLSLQNEFRHVGESFQKATDVEITIDYGLWPRSLSKNLDAFFISFMQEALTNALKHGRAAKVSALCWNDGARIGMTITDNGTGTSFPLKKGIGITAMEDAASQFNGTISIVCGPDGFKISAAVPADMF